MVIHQNSRPSLLDIKIVCNLFTNKKGITIRDLSKNLKTDYKNTHDAVNKLFKKGVIKKEKMGNYNICRLNYSSDDMAIHLEENNFYIKINNFRKKYPAEYRIITETCKQFSREMGHLFICLAFGSYAAGNEKKDSDVDLLFLTPFSKAEPMLNKILNKINAPYKKKLHLIEQSIINFIEDLKKNELNIANEIQKELPIVFYGSDIFFKIMIEAENDNS